MAPAAIARGEGDVDGPAGRRSGPSAPCGGAVYGLGFIGAFVWFWRQSDGAGERAVGALRAIVWPAFLVYEAFQAVQRPRE
jgi:hypothetical protein